MEKPGYFAIIPAEVRYDPDLRPNEKLLFGEITALASKEGFCWATNNYFATLFGVSTRVITTWISNLKKKGYIKVFSDRDANKVIQRRIYIGLKPPEGVEQNFQGGGIKVPGGYGTKLPGGMEQKFQENNTSKNNTYLNNTSNDILSYFNEKMGKNLKMTDSLKKLIHGRLNEGFTLEDFKKVIDTKYAQWHKDIKMKQYLRPSTLFAPSHFQEYLNEDARKELGKVWK